jgi:hypothetical protein
LAQAESIPHKKNYVVRDLYLSGIAEEFVAMQLDLENPIVIGMLKELEVYKAHNEEVI